VNRAKPVSSAAAAGVGRLVELPTLDEVAAEPERARELPRDTLFTLATRCATVQGILLAALAAGGDVPAPEEDRLLTTREAARLLNRTPDWLYRHGDELPFTVRRPGHHPRFSSRGIQSYIGRQVALQAAGKGA
jgi:hypothetical protein